MNEAGSPSNSNPPTQLPPVKKRRGLSFWLLVILLILLGIPLLLFLGALGYVKSGGANDHVLNEIKKVFGGKVSVGSTSSDWLNNLRIHQLAVDGNDGRRALDVREVHVQWDPQELLGENRIRQVDVLGPKATLVRDASAKWNLEIKPPQPGSGKVRVDRIRVSEGEASLEWAPGRALHLQALSGNLTSAGPDAPQAFAFYGVLDSLNTLTLNGTLGPGAAWTLRGDGGLDLQRDAGPLLGTWLGEGPAGQVRLSVSARSDALLVDTTRGGPIHLDATLDFEKVRMRLPGGMKLKLDRDRMDLRCEIVPPSKPGEALALNGLQLRADPALNLQGAIRVAPDRSLRMESVSGEIDAAALLSRLEPSPLPASMSLRGTLQMDQAALSFPTDSAPWSARAKVTGRELRTSWAGYGELPRLDVTATVNWPALDNVELNLYGTGKIGFSLNDARLNTSRLAHELVEKATFHTFEIDIAQLWESEVGRRLLTGTLDATQPPPPAGQLPYHVRGTIHGDALKLTTQPVGTDLDRVALSGLRTRGMAVLKWPFPFNVPARTFSGPMQFEFDLRKNGTLAGFSIAKKFTATVAPGEIPLEATLAQRFSLENGAMQMGPLKLQNVTLPFVDLDQIFAVRERTGLQSAGLARFKNLECDLIKGDVAGDFQIEKGRFRIPFPASAQKATISALRSLDYPTVAAIFESYPIEELVLADFSVGGSAQLKDGTLELRGRSEACSLNAVLPVSIPLFSSLKEPEVFKLPGADFKLALDTRLPPGQRALALQLDWGGGKVLALNLKEAGKPEAWTASGSIKIPGADGLSAHFDVPFDLAAQTLGPVSADIEDIALDLLAEKFLKNPQGLPAVSGRMRNVRLELRSVSLKNVSAAAFANGKLSGQLDNVAYSAPPLVELAQLTGPFTFDLQSRGDTFGVNALFKLTNYEALLNDGAVYITQPEPNKFGAIRWVGTIRRESTGLTIQQNQAELALEDDVSAEASGTFRVANGQLASANLATLRVFAKNLKRSIAKYVKPHLEHRAPWFGDIGLDGSAYFDGTLSATPGAATPGAAAPALVQGDLNFQNARVTLGKGAAFRIDGLNGALPVLLQLGATPPSTETRRAQLTVGPLVSDGLRAERQTLNILAGGNALKIESPLRVETALGAMTLGGITMRNLISDKQEPAIDFTLSTRIDLNRILRDAGAAIEGMEETVLSGEPIFCTLEKTSGLRGPWALSTRGLLKGPFYGGNVLLENLRARGIFGPAPVFGADCALTGGADGIRWTQFTLKNQQLGETLSGVAGKPLGKFSLRANASIRGIEMTAPTAAGLQAFVFDFDSVPYKENEFYFDGELAMTLNEPLVRAAFPSILFSRDKIARMTFGVKNIGLQYELRDGGLYGPRPKLPGDLILEGYGTDSGIGAIFERRLRQDIKGDYKNVIPWAAIVKSLQGRKSAAPVPAAK